MVSSMRHRRPPPSLFTKREITHVGLLVSALLLLALSSHRIQQPSSWGWFIDSVPTELTEGNASDATLLAPASDGAPGAEPPLALAAPPPAELVVGDTAKVNPLGLEQTDECLEVDTVLLSRVKDKTPRRAEESEAIYQILCVAATKAPGELHREARKDVLFANLFNDPGEYRGKPVHIRGILRRLVRWEGKELKNAYGIPHFYEGWVFTEDQPHNPIQILFTKLPEGLEPGTELKENVAFDGYFFKLFAYQALDRKWHAAPMLLGYELDWQRVPTSNIAPNAILTLLGIASVFLLAGLAIWWQSKRDESLAEKIRARAGPPPTPEMGFLEPGSSSDSIVPDATSGDGS